MRFAKSFVSAVLLSAVACAAMIAASNAQQKAGQDCGTVFECAKLAVEAAADARAALKQTRDEIAVLRDQLNKYEARLKDDETAIQTSKKMLDEMHNSLAAAKWGEKKDSPPFRGAPDAPRLGSCDAGYYVVGVTAWEGTARVGGGNIYQLQLDCRKLNVP